MLNYLNIFGLLAFITLILQTPKVISSKDNNNNKIQEISVINQYLYYFPQKEIILCSDKLYTNSDINLIPNEIKLKENEFTCLINNDNNKYLKINLNIMKPISNNSDKDSLDILLGDSLVFRNLLFASKENSNFYTKNLFVKIDKERNKVFYLENENNQNNENGKECEFTDAIKGNGNLDNCRFKPVKDSLFKGNHLMLNLRLNDSNKNFSFIEKKANSNF